MIFYCAKESKGPLQGKIIVRFKCRVCFFFILFDMILYEVISPTQS